MNMPVNVETIDTGNLLCSVRQNNSCCLPLFPWSDVQPSNIPLSCKTNVTVFLQQKDEDVTASCHHPELFPVRSVMSIVGFLPYHSWVPPGVSSCPVSPSPPPFSLVPSTGGRAAQLQHRHTKGPWPCGVSPALSSGKSIMRPLATGHL